MYRSRRLLSLLGVVLCSMPLHAHHLAVVVPKDNHVKSITSTELEKIVKSDTRKWMDGNAVVVVMTKNSANSLQVLGRLCNKSQTEIRSFVMARPNLFILADSDAALLAIVGKTPGALGIVDVRAINDTVRVLRVDGKLPMEPGYLPH